MSGPPHHPFDHGFEPPGEAGAVAQGPRPGIARQPRLQLLMQRRVCARSARPWRHNPPPTPQYTRSARSPSAGWRPFVPQRRGPARSAAAGPSAGHPTQSCRHCRAWCPETDRPAPAVRGSGPDQRGPQRSAAPPPAHAPPSAPSAPRGFRGCRRSATAPTPSTPATISHQAVEHRLGHLVVMRDAAEDERVLRQTPLPRG